MRGMWGVRQLWVRAPRVQGRGLGGSERALSSVQWSSPSAVLRSHREPRAFTQSLWGYRRAVASETHVAEAVELPQADPDQELKRRPFYSAFLSGRYQQARRLCYSELLHGPFSHLVGQAYVNILMDTFEAGKKGSEYLAKLLATEECDMEAIPEGHWKAVKECDIEANEFSLSIVKAIGQAIGLAAEKELAFDGEQRDMWALIHVTLLQARARVEHSHFKVTRNEEHFDRAVADLKLSGQVQKSIASVPDSSEHCARLGFLYIVAAGLHPPSERRTRLLNEAEHHFDQGIAITPEDPEVWFGKGMVQQTGGNLATAVEHFGQATKVAEQYAPAWQARGGCHLLLNNAWEAAADFTNFLKHAPEYFTLTGEKEWTAPEVLGAGLLRRGVAYYRIDDMDMAAADFKACLDLGHDPARAHHLLGKVRAKEGNWWDCIVENSKSLDVQVTTYALEARATAFQAIGKDTEAERDRRQLNLLRSQNAYASK